MPVVEAVQGHLDTKLEGRMMNDNNKNKMTIGELADAAGVTVRTIRYYVNEGLLPPPEQSGRYALYENWYLDRLELIRRWKDAYLPLKEIRTRIAPLSNEEVRRMLKQPEARPQMPKTAAMAAEPWEGEEAKPEETAQEPASPANALDYIHDVQAGKAPPKQSREEVADYIRQARRESRRDVKPAPLRVPAPRPSSTGKEWRRIEIFPGLEIHVMEDISRRYWRELEALMDWISRNLPQLRV